MNNPQMMQMMQSQEFQQAMMSLQVPRVWPSVAHTSQTVCSLALLAQSDPELAPLFQQAQSGGPAGVMSMAQNPKVMRKLSEKLGPLYSKAGMPGAAAPQAPPSQVSHCWPCLTVAEEVHAGAWHLLCLAVAAVPLLRPCDMLDRKRSSLSRCSSRPCRTRSSSS